MASIRTRIAPSPTGQLHVGTARSALFNELFAHAAGGKFILRIEDTDKARSLPEYEKNIIEGLKWLGLNWDEGPDIGGEFGPYQQSERTKFYRAALERLLTEKKAYQEPGSAAVKLKVNSQEVVFNDLIRGRVKVHSDTWGGDFVIARSLNDPVFHLAVVVDDAAAKITHVIRGEDHLTNTARHILLQQALGYETPIYAHLPLLLDSQRRKLSKRAGEVSLLAYRDRGFLPEAMLNYLALLGWNPKTDQEFFTREELLKVFTIDGIQKNGAVFSEAKLTAVNKYYIRKLSAQELLRLSKPFLIQGGYDIGDSDYWAKAIACEQARVGTLAELPTGLTFFKPDWAAGYEASLLVWKKSDAAATRELLKKINGKIESSPEAFSGAEELSKQLLTWIDQAMLGRGDALWPMRVALTGQANSPGPFEVAAVLGQKETLRRLQIAINKLS